MTIATVEMPAEELEQHLADLASARAEVKRLRAGVPPDQELEKLRAERDHLAQQNTLLRDAANKLHRAEAANRQLQRAVDALVAERDTARGEATDTANRYATLRESNRQLSQKLSRETEKARQRGVKVGNLQKQINDLEVALVAAGDDRLMQQTLARGLDRAIDENRRLTGTVRRARKAAGVLLHMEREHTGSGREGHLSENDLRPLLHALDIDTEEQP